MKNEQRPRITYCRIKTTLHLLIFGFLMVLFSCGQANEKTSIAWNEVFKYCVLHILLATHFVLKPK